jgi:hypothetical protein
LSLAAAAVDSPGVPRASIRDNIIDHSSMSMGAPAAEVRVGVGPQIKAICYARFDQARKARD